MGIMTQEQFAAQNSNVGGAPIGSPTGGQPNSTGDAAARGFSKGLSFGAGNKVDGAEAVVGRGLRKIMPQSWVDRANAAEGTQADPRVNPSGSLATAATALNPMTAAAGVPQMIMNMMVLAGSKSQNETMGQTYARVRDQGVAIDSENHQNHRIASVAGEMAGALVPTVVTGGLGGAGEAAAGADVANAALTGGKFARIAQAAKSGVGGAITGAATGAVKGAAQGAVYGANSEDGGDVMDKLKAGGIGALWGGMAGGTFGGLAKSLGTVRQLVADPSKLPGTVQQQAVKVLQDAGYDVKTVQDVQKLIRQTAETAGVSTDEAVNTLAGQLGQAVTKKDTTAIDAISNLIGSKNATAGKIAQAVGSAAAKDTDSDFVSGVNKIRNSQPDASAPTKQGVGFTGKTSTNPNANDSTPLPSAASPFFGQKLNQALPGASSIESTGDKLGGTLGDAISDSDPHVDGSDTTGPDTKERQDQSNEILHNLGSNPDSPDFAQKTAQLNPKDLSNVDSNDTDDGQVSDDVPNVIMKNGLKYVMAPNGTEIEVS